MREGCTALKLALGLESGREEGMMKKKKKEGKGRKEKKKRKEKEKEKESKKRGSKLGRMDILL